jgi:hypothetical protein
MDIKLMITIAPMSNAITATPIKIRAKVDPARFTCAMVAAGLVKVKSSSADGRI